MIALVVAPLPAWADEPSEWIEPSESVSGPNLRYLPFDPSALLTDDDYATVTDDDRDPLWWRRDDRGAQALQAQLDPGRGTTIVDGMPRLPGSAAFASELSSARSAAWGHAPIDQAGASGGTDAVTLLHGHNDGELAARLALGRHSRLAATAATDLIRDKAWWSTGVVLDQGAGGMSTQVLTTVTLQPDAEHAVDGAMLVGGAPGDARDGWLHLRALAKTDNHAREVEVAIVTHGLDVGPLAAAMQRLVSGVAAPREVDRTGGRLVLRQRLRRHQVQVGGELGGGEVDGVAHTDMRAFAGDRWQHGTRWTVDGGLRWDRRVIGATEVELVSPRVQVAYAADLDGGSYWFAGVERVGQLDERFFGAWRDGATYGDTAYAGHARDVGRWRVVAAVRGRAPHAAAEDDRRGVGLEGSAQWRHPRKHLDGKATVSTLERAATVEASWSCGCDHDVLALTAIARATPERVAWGSAASYAFGRELRTTIGAEVLDDAQVRSARLVLAATW